MPVGTHATQRRASGDAAAPRLSRDAKCAEFRSIICRGRADSKDEIGEKSKNSADGADAFPLDFNETQTSARTTFNQLHTRRNLCVRTCI
jgi:hypothetical protein